MKRRTKRPIPILLLWSKKEQLRFCDSVEAIVSVARDLKDQVDQLRAERQAGQRKYERRKQARTGQPAGEQLGAEAATIAPAGEPGPDGEGGAM